MRISGGSALAKDEIERMIKEAEAHADEDRQRREEAEVRNTAEQLVYSTEKFLRDNDDKLPAEGKAEVNVAVADLKKALDGTDIAEVKAKHEALSAASQRTKSFARRQRMWFRRDPRITWLGVNDSIETLTPMFTKEWRAWLN